MSDAAKASVKDIVHPKVKGCARALLDHIAELIPEGGTMTPPMADQELATRIGYDERTLQRGRKVLAAVRMVRVVGGGRGRVASYELLALSGAGAPPSLPLRADLREASRAPVDTPLFDSPIDQEPATPASSIRAYTVRHFVGRCGSYVRHLRHFVGRFRAYTLRHFVGRCGSNIRHFVGRLLPLDVDDARARDVRTHFKNVHTHTAPRDELQPVEHPWHAWCRGLVHVPKFLHEEFRRDHPRPPGAGDGEVESTLRAFYARKSAVFPRRLGENEIAYWRRAYADEFSSTVTPRTGRDPRRPDIWNARPCPHEPLCEDAEACIDRSQADWHAKREQSG